MKQFADVGMSYSNHGSTEPAYAARSSALPDLYFLFLGNFRCPWSKSHCRSYDWISEMAC